MLRPRFFTTQTLNEGACVALEKAPSRHIAKALRMRVQDPLCLFNGSGREARGQIIGIDKDCVRVEVCELSAPPRESPLQSILVIALSRGDRMDMLVQKATELGVSEIWPMISERTGLRLDAERLAKKREHWERVAISACEQCGRNTLPRIAAATPYAKSLSTAAQQEASLRLILHPDGEPSALPPQCRSLIMLVGPEGGFSEAEVLSARDAGFRAFQLGPRILRTETAPLAGLAVAQARWGDFPS